MKHAKPDRQQLPSALGDTPPGGGESLEVAIAATESLGAHMRCQNSIRGVRAVTAYVAPKFSSSTTRHSVSFSLVIPRAAASVASSKRSQASTLCSLAALSRSVARATRRSWADMSPNLRELA
jgi:hypothetical protein